MRKGSYTTFNIVKDAKNLRKERENPKNLVDDKKMSSEIFALEMEIFPEKNVIQINLGSRKIFRPPQTRRQVSATGYTCIWQEIKVSPIGT